MYLNIDENIDVKTLDSMELNDVKCLLRTHLGISDVEDIITLLSAHGYAIVRNKSYPERWWV